MRTPLDSLRVERIHARLLVRYGARWTGLWQGIEPELVRRDWAIELGGLSDAAIAYALDHLPDDPPQVLRFRALALSAPPPPVAALPAPNAGGKRRAAEALGRLAELQRERGPLDWARELRRREKAGERLSSVQAAAWREALRSEMRREAA